jgi:Tfp pilus assembly pilus retraction ATPase PilT
VLDERSALALIDLVGSGAESAGFIKVPVDQKHAFDRFAARWLPELLGDAPSEDLVGLSGSGRFIFISVPPSALVALEVPSSRLSKPAQEELAEDTDAIAWVQSLDRIVGQAKKRASGAPDLTLLLFPHWVEVADGHDDEATQGSPPADEGEPLLVSELLGEASRRRATDLHLVAGVPPTLRIGGRLAPVEGSAVLSARDVQRLCYAFLTDEQKDRLERERSLSTSFGVRELGRFRATLYFQRGSLAAALRLIPFEIRPLKALGLGAKVQEALERAERGLIVLAGAPGSGRSTTAAAILDRMNSAGRTIFTLESPIEHFHSSRTGLVSQCEIPEDAPTLESALLGLAHSGADVVLIDTRDEAKRLDTAVSLAAGGPRLVVCSLTAIDAGQALRRLTSFSSADHLRALGSILVHQRLAPGKTGLELSAELVLPS